MLAAMRWASLHVGRLNKNERGPQSAKRALQGIALQYFALSFEAMLTPQKAYRLVGAVKIMSPALLRTERPVIFTDKFLHEHLFLGRSRHALLQK